MNELAAPIREILEYVAALEDHAIDEADMECAVNFEVIRLTSPVRFEAGYYVHELRNGRFAELFGD